MTKLSPEKDQRRRDLHAKGMSDSAIAKVVGVNKSIIRDWRSSRRLPLNPSLRFLSGDEKNIILMLHDQKTPTTTIAETLGRNRLTIVRFLKQNGLPTIVMSRKIAVEERAVLLLDALDEKGPMTLPELWGMGFSKHVITWMIRELYDYVEVVTMFPPGSHGKVRTNLVDFYDGSRVYGGMRIVALKNDPRIIDYIADRMIFDIKNGRDAQTVLMILRSSIGRDRAREVVQRRGHKYSELAMSRWRN